MLGQAESVAQLLDARTAAAADSALAGLGGGIGEGVRRMRVEGLTLLADLDARLDFEEELDPLEKGPFADRIKSMHAEVGLH